MGASAGGSCVDTLRLSLSTFAFLTHRLLLRTHVPTQDDRYACLRDTGLERGPALANDIDYMVSTWNLTRTPPTGDSAGSAYAAKIRDLAANNPPAFICHYYNFYFAHTAGGRMIGKQVSEAALDGWMGAFYKWDGPVSSLLNNVRDSLNDMGGSGMRKRRRRAWRRHRRRLRWPAV